MSVTPPLDLDETRAERDVADLGSSSCRSCEIVRDTAFCGDLTLEEVRRLAVARGHTVLGANVTIFREGDAIEHIYSVSSGAVKLYKLLSDGRRQVIGFLFPGDLFGLGLDGQYAYTAETVTTTQLCRFIYRKLEGVLDETPRLERRLFAMTLRTLAAAQEQMLLLGRKTASEKVATFLLRLSRRNLDQGQPASPVALPMSRADIADHLGLTIETVSRTFTQLKRDGIIGLPSSGHVVLIDSVRLRELAEGAAAS